MSAKRWMMGAPESARNIIQRQALLHQRRGVCRRRDSRLGQNPAIA